jgi:hypothetical protein
MAMESPRICLRVDEQDLAELNRILDDLRKRKKDPSLNLSDLVRTAIKLLIIQYSQQRAAEQARQR